MLLGAGMTAESLLAVGLLIAGSIFSAMSTMVWVDEETRSGIDDGYFWYKGVISDQKYPSSMPLLVSSSRCV